MAWGLRTTSALFFFITTLTLVNSNSVGLQGMGENCILSFVVPREKMKSSCQVDGKLQRRINSMEMKVNIYKQQVAELGGQLEKQRVFNIEKISTLEKKVKESTVNADMSFLIERRLALLEKEFEQLHDELAQQAKTPWKEQSTGFNALDNNPVTLPNLVRSMVKSEVKVMMETINKRLDNYVQEQVLLYDQVFNILSKPESQDKSGRTFSMPEHSVGKEERESIDPASPQLDEELQKGLDKVKATMDNTRHMIAKHVDAFVQNATSADRVDPGASAASLNGTILFNDSHSLDLEPLGTEDVQPTNDTYSGGDHPDSPQIVDADNLTSLDTQIPVSSRMSHGVEEKGSSPEVGDQGWMDNMVQDQRSRQTALKDSLKAEISSMLSTPLAEVVSLVEKQSAKVEAEMARERRETAKVRARVDTMEHSLHQWSAKLDSLAQEVQTVQPLAERLGPLEETVQVLRKNVSGSVGQAQVLQDVDEQSKKVKKLERLIGVYQHSLDHYRNETKLEYRELMAKVEQDTKSLRTVSTQLQANLATTIDTSLSKLNNTYQDKFQDIDNKIRINQDNAMLLQIDINNVERKVSGKSSRSEKEIAALRDNIRQATNKHRDFRRRMEAIEQEQTILVEQINTTTKDVFELKTEVKLSLLDEWLPLPFDYDSSRTECFGDQYVKKSPFPKARLVGVVLCSHKRYKIFLSNSLQSTFLNVGDTEGLGEDHCEFVGATNDKKITLAPFAPSFSVVKGYARRFWGEEPQSDYLNAIKPSPLWYECGIKIP